MANNDKPMYRLGIDVGSASLAAVLKDENKRVVEKGYCLYHGDMRSAFCGLMGNMLRRAGDAALCRAAVCGVNRDSVKIHQTLIVGLHVNEITALIAGACFASPNAYSVMNINLKSSK